MFAASTCRVRAAAGVSYSNTVLGLSFSCLATLLNFCWLCVDKSVLLGKYWRISQQGYWLYMFQQRVANFP